jgi:siroheme synthase (precorrin-2 oxidase/ferrochelatase)
MGVLPSAIAAFSGRPVVLIGSGPVATAALHELVDAGASDRRFSRSVDVAEDLWLQRKPELIEITFRDLKSSDLIEAAAVVAAVGEPLARCVAEQARDAACPIHVVGRPDLSTLDRDDLSGPDGDVRATIPVVRPASARAAEWLSQQLAALAS